MGKKHKIAKLNEEMITAADTILKEHITQYGNSGTEGARRRAILSMYSAMTGIGAPAAEFEKALADFKTSVIGGDASDPIDAFEDEEDVDSTEEDFDDTDVHPAETALDDEDFDDDGMFDDDTDDATWDEDDTEGALADAEGLDKTQVLATPLYDLGSLETSNVKTLKEMAAKHDIEGASSMNKHTLVQVLAAIPQNAETSSEFDISDE